MEKQTVLDWVNGNEKRLSDWHQTIWQYAEPVWREYKSSAWYVERLRQEGFEVEVDSAGMPTAFVATYGSGKPVLGAYAEYDAVPGNSQQAVPYRAPREGLHRWAPGHTDPHSALGIGALGGVLAAKAAREKHGLAGTLKFFGEPAEKTCGSKPIHALYGYYDDVDAFISFHPAYTLPLSNTTRWDTHCGSSYGRVYTFECESPETWAPVNERLLMPVAHTMARAPGALDAVCLMYTTTKYTKEAMLPHTGGWFIGEAILVGGQATADNLAPRIGQIYYCWRAPTLQMQERILQVLENNAAHVAEITHCKVTGSWVQKNRPGLANHALADLTYRNLELAGPPEFGEAAKAFGRQIQKNMGFEQMAEPIMPEAGQLIAPMDAEAILRQSLPPWQLNSTTDDYVELAWHAPTVRLYIGRAMLQLPRPDYMYPLWVWNAMGGMPACIDPTIFCASRTIGTTLVDLLTKPEELAKARSEFEARTGGGVGGKKWLAPLLPPGFKAPVHFRWPEYVTTARGEEWWIPIGDQGGR